MESGTEEKASTTDGDVVEVTNEQSNTAPASKAPPKGREKAVGRGWRWLALLMILLLMVVIGAVSWFGFQLYQGVEQAQKNSQEQARQIAAATEQFETDKSTVLKNGAAVEAQLVDIKNTLESQARSLAELSTLDRNQWLIAELEYLVRLANQRLLTERRPQGALALLEAADKLLGSMDNVGALTARSVLANDIAALRLVEVMDREGVYTRLGALMPAVLSLAALPSQDLSELLDDGGAKPDRDDAINSNSAVTTEPTETRTWYSQLWLNAKAALGRFSRDHFHVRYRDMRTEALISTEQEQWLRHNMANNITSAQLALIREEQEIYTASLASVEDQLQSYFKGSFQAQKLIAEIEALKNLNIKQDLPDISASIGVPVQLQLAPTRQEDVRGEQP